MRLTAGTSSRLGASWDGRGTNFALFSANAQKVELCLFDGQGRRELERIELPARTEDVWHGYVNDVSPVAPAAPARTCRSTGATMRAACPRPSWSTRPSTGAAAKCAPTSPGKTPHSRKST